MITHNWVVGGHYCYVIAVPLLLCTAVSLPAQVIAVWTDRANGQQFDCNGNIDGGQYSWPDNNNWAQSIQFAPDPCGVLAVRRPSNWSTPNFPSNGLGGVDYDVLIDSGPAVDLHVATIVDALTLTFDTAINILAGGRLTIDGGDIDNRGAIVLAGDSAEAATLVVDGESHLLGSGTLQFATDGINELAAAHEASMINIATSQFISTLANDNSRGTISAPFVNHGTIEANAGTLTLTGYDKSNLSILRARGGGQLLIEGVVLENSNGLILASGLGRVSIANSTVAGGFFATSGGSIEVVGSGTVFDGTVQAVTILNGATVSVVSGGELTLRNRFTNNGTLELRDVASGNAELTIEGPLVLDGIGTLRIPNSGDDGNILRGAGESGVLVVGANQQLVAETGSFAQLQLPVSNEGIILLDGSISLSDQGAIINAATGRITGSGTVDLGGTALVNTGVIEPGTSTGTLTFRNGTFLQVETGRLKIDIGGTQPGTTLDQLSVTGGGVARLAGVLQVSLSDIAGERFTPQLGDSFEVLVSDRRLQGEFTTISLPRLDDGLGWEINQREDAVELRVVAGGLPLAGDYNGNNVVEQGDLDLVLLNWGRELSDPIDIGWIYDLPNSSIAQAQMDQALLNWGSTFSAATVKSVPEPTSVLMFLLNLICTAYLVVRAKSC